jgi:hypothetical protein
MTKVTKSPKWKKSSQSGHPADFLALHLFTPAPDALDQVEQQLARHGLDAGRKGLVVDVVRKQLKTS